MVTQVTKEIHRFLELHILELLNNKINIANRYLRNYEKYIQVLNFLNSYIKFLEAYMDDVGINTGEHIPPFVIIGSTVEIEDVSSRGKRSILITETDDGGEDGADYFVETVPFLSEMGKKLLLKEEGQIVSIRNLESESAFRINRISYNLNL